MYYSFVFFINFAFYLLNYYLALKKHFFLAILYSILIVYVLGYLSIEFFENYGWTLFLLAPLLLGFLPSFIVSNRVTVTRKESYMMGFIALFIACIALLVLGIEGIVCILMSLPLFIISTLLGIVLVHRVNIRNINNPKIILALIVGYIFAFFTLDYVNYTEDLIPVTSTIVIENSIEKVWGNAIKGSQFSKPDLLLDKLGIAYPKSSQFKSEGIGAIREYNFTTGSYLQAVSKWDPPYIVEFNTKEAPIHMTENNPFWEISPTHLFGYFVSIKGAVKLTELSSNKTKVENTTWYQVHMTPIPYWKLWSNGVVKRFQKAFLENLKDDSEN